MTRRIVLLIAAAIAGTVAAGCAGTTDEERFDDALRRAGEIDAEHRYFDERVLGGAAVRIEHVSVVKDARGAWKGSTEISLPVPGQNRVVVERILGLAMENAQRTRTGPRTISLLEEAAAVVAEEQRVLTSVLDAGIESRGRVQVLSGNHTACAIMPVELDGTAQVVQCGNWEALSNPDEVAYAVSEVSGMAHAQGSGWVDTGRAGWVKDRSVTPERYMELVTCPSGCADGAGRGRLVLEMIDGKVGAVRLAGRDVRTEIRLRYEQVSGIDLGLLADDAEQPGSAKPGEINDTTPGARQAEIIGRRIGDTLLGGASTDLASLREIAERAPGDVFVARLEGGETRAFDAEITAAGERFCVRVVMLVEGRTGTPNSKAQARPGGC